MKIALRLAPLCLLLTSLVFAQSALLRSDHSRLAAEALFNRSDLVTAKSEVTLALKADPRNTRALFVSMEAAALDADDAGVLRSATRLCDAVVSSSDEEMCEIAAARIASLAGNTETFRESIPQLRELIATGSSQSEQLKLALVSAAADGAPEFDLLMQSRESGLLTDWKMVGPLGKYPNSDFDRALGPEQDGMRRKSYAARRVTKFQFADGKVELPESSLRQKGVFYASSELALGSGGEWRVWVDSPGTLEVFIDGQSVVRKDDRTSLQPQTMWKTRRIDNGNHRVIVKFLLSALPFRVAVMAPTGGVKRKNNKPALHAGPESEYTSVALKYWRKDYLGAARELSRNSLSRRAVYAALLAQTWTESIQSGSREQMEALRAATADVPGLRAAELAMAERDAASNRIDDALARLKAILKQDPENEGALRTFAQVAARLNWRAEATDAYDRLINQHPSCTNLRGAAWFFDSTAQFRRAESLEPAMKRCAPASLLYAEWLAKAGRHQEAAKLASDIATTFQLHRDALVMAAEEARLAGQSQLAKSASAALSALSDERLRLATLNSADDPRSAGLFDGADFYSQYRRDGIQLVRDLDSRRFSGGLSVLLLNDKVIHTTSSGSTATYVHTIIRLLNREAIEKLGEVAIPPGAEILELRSVKPDGSVAEPELNEHKSTISMPALSPGDSIEQEYVLRSDGPPRGNDDAQFSFAFGSIASPVLLSRLVLISPRDIRVRVSAGTPAVTEAHLRDGESIRTWERNDIAQSTNEGLLPKFDILPIIRVEIQSDDASATTARLHESAVDASRVGIRASLLGPNFSDSGSAPAEQLYTYTVTKLSQDKSDFTTGEVTNAEQTLATHQGSRVAALLALARAAGLNTDLAFARQMDSQDFSHPIVIFHLDGREVFTDPESDGLPFGVLSPTLDRTNALLIPTGQTAQTASLVRLPALEGRHLSLAEADLVLDREGTFTGHVTITLGASRATQMREIMRTIPTTQRTQFFEQLANRLFPGSVSAAGEVINEYDINQPMRLELTCSATRFFDLTKSRIDIDQLVPTLGLRRMYANQSSRSFPLYIDSLQFESALFRIHLPDGVRVLRTVNDLHLQSDFGTYKATFAVGPGSTLIIRREFRIPVQVVEPSSYPAFAQFAARIDDTEHLRLTLGVDRAQLLP